MVSLKCSPWQLNYLYYIFTFFATCSESTHDKLYILLGADLQQRLTRLIAKNKASCKLKLTAVESLLFNECIDMYLDSIKLDKKLIIEKRYLSQLCNETKKATN